MNVKTINGSVHVAGAWEALVQGQTRDVLGWVNVVYDDADLEGITDARGVHGIEALIFSVVDGQGHIVLACRCTGYQGLRPKSVPSLGEQLESHGRGWGGTI